MNLNDHRKAEKLAHGHYMYFEAAERGYDPKAAQKAWDDYRVTSKKREQAEEAGNRNVLAALADLVAYHRSLGYGLKRDEDSKAIFLALLDKHGLEESLADSARLIEVLLGKAQDAIDFLSGGAA